VWLKEKDSFRALVKFAADNNEAWTGVKVFKSHLEALESGDDETDDELTDDVEDIEELAV
jgi:hypothetical protein